MSTARFSKLGLAKLTEFENNKLKAYWDNIGRIWTIGRGHTGSLSALAKSKDTTNLPNHFDMLEVYEGLEITEEQSLVLCKSDLGHVFNVVDDFSDSGAYLTNNQYSALAIWAYNIGAHAAENSSLAQYVDDCVTARTSPEALTVEIKLRQWNKAKGVIIKGLVNRRQKEIDLYNTPDDPTDLEGAFP